MVKWTRWLHYLEELWPVIFQPLYLYSTSVHHNVEKWAAWRILSQYSFFFKAKSATNHRHRWHLDTAEVWNFLACGLCWCRNVPLSTFPQLHLKYVWLDDVGALKPAFVLCSGPFLDWTGTTRKGSYLKYSFLDLVCFCYIFALIYAGGLFFLWDLATLLQKLTVLPRNYTTAPVTELTIIKLGLTVEYLKNHCKGSIASPAFL